jgi:two-component system chemotaxis sensor kinase CheA
MDDLIAEFLTETNESLAEADLALVKLERTPDDQATLGLIFRLVHTIKGTCGFLGLPRLERVAHAAENVLGRVRDRELAAAPPVISAVLAALDRIKIIVAGLSAGGAEPAGDDAAIIAALERVATGDFAAAAPAAPAAPTPTPTPAPTHAAENAAPPPDAEPPEPSPEPAAAPPPDAPAEAVMGVQSIRVSVDVLEELMTLVGELVLTRNQLLQISRAEGTSAFSAPLQRLSHITTDLQEGVMKTRMQPIGNAWNKLPRLVRDLAHETGKKITLDMHGQDTELDRQVLELMRDPLTHMVRNSADHGLEIPEERRAASKPEAGRIRLNAFHEGGHIIIEVSDDGRGLDVSKIREKVLSKGLATEAELAAMSEAQIRAFIFRAGFSTAAAVTAISGRGVGMDVVRSNIERIGGTVELASTFGAGTCFTIKIPLTLAIVSALIVRACGERFAIPQISVLELVRVGTAAAAGASMAIETIGRTPVLRLRDQLLPLVTLGELLRLNDASAVSATATVVVTAVGSGMLGIVVDDVYDTEEIVVKPVAPILRHVTMFSGNTILGDGSVIMILDPNGVARSAGISTSRNQRAEAEAALQATRSTDGMALLLFRAGGDPGPRAVPLGLVARLEDVDREKIEHMSGGFVTQYRGKLMPLIGMGGGAPGDAPTQPVLVFAEGERSMGLMVDEIVDVVHDKLTMELGSGHEGLLGTAVIAGQATDVLDTGYWLTRAWQDWFGGAATATARRQRVLVVEDSDFFRQMLVPTLAAAGYDVTAAASAAEALHLRDGGLVIDAIVSDIEMPDMDGFEFAKRVREGGAWAALPLLALTGRGAAADEARGRDAGFTDYCQKFEREGLLASLRHCLTESVLL